MRLHVVGLPHTETLAEYNQCAYTAKVRKFASMMTKRGHEVYLYSSGRNEALCTRHITVLSPYDFQQEFKDYDWWHRSEWFGVSWDDQLPYWRNFNERAIAQIREHIEPQDFICLITGYPQRSIADAFPNHMTVEYGVGYEGVYTPYRVFESYAWMHMLYGKQGPSSADGKFYDAVIPNYFDVNEFPEHTGDGDYLLFMSRMTPRKGYSIAIDLAERVGCKLVVAGTGGDRPESDVIEYVGYADAERRGELMAGAKALICPTIYVEPFGGVVAEAMMCGTPVLTTDFGAFTETVLQGTDGFRCRTMQEFEQGFDALDTLNPSLIRMRAQSRFATTQVAIQFERHFERLMTLWGDGFYTHAAP